VTALGVVLIVGGLVLAVRDARIHGAPRLRVLGGMVLESPPHAEPIPRAQRTTRAQAPSRLELRRGSRRGNGAGITATRRCTAYATCRSLRGGTIVVGSWG
jgi:hypothetical protein